MRLGTPASEQEAGEQRQTNNPDDGRHGVGLHGAAGARRLMGCNLRDGGAFVAEVVRGLVKAGLGNGSCLPCELGQMFLGQIARFRGSMHQRLADAASFTFIYAVQPSH